MYVCICNSINDREVESAIQSGVEAWEDVHNVYGCKPKCGQCRAEIVEAIVDHRIKPTEQGLDRFSAKVITVAE
ncbi:MAG: hypothetical protein CFH41_01567 [Alphaproteobacteria bacterium MarineAlpha11_Bin1]|nr:MAG: hypothetical protein CFH41_01567 [Alphaproteobacteria bacterium MarineAlpha11_Bin1]